VRRSVHGHLRDFLNSGGRKIDAWYATLNTIEVSFDDQPEAFANINTANELKDFERRE
jgi:molybdenum cofactor guanylyltransferase